MKLRSLISVGFIIGFLSVNAQKSDFDAEYLTHETREKFSLQKSKKYKEFVREVTVYKKIKVLSTYGVENYNRLYIPTYEDLDTRSVLLEFEGKTIKSNGTEIILDQSNFKETSLPGNNKYLRNYEGSVKLIAFPQLDEGDIVEYSYKIRYIQDFSYEFGDSYEIIFQKNIPVRTFSHSIEVSNKLEVQLLEFNLEEGIDIESNEDNTTYSFNAIGLEPIEYESYSHEYSYLPHISILISTQELNLERTWERRLDQIDKKPPARFKFFSDYSINELVSQARGLSTTEEKVRLICDSVYLEKRDTLSNNYYSRGAGLPNWYVNNKYLRLFQKLGIKGNLVYLRPFSEGEFDESLIALSQFSLSLIEFEDASGEKHYLTPRDPYTAMDDVPFKYQGAKALRIKNLFGTIKVETFNFPYSSSDKLTCDETREFSFSLKNDSLIYDAQLERNTKGFSEYSFLSTYYNKVDSNLSSFAESRIDNTIFGRRNIVIKDSKWESEVLDYYTSQVNLKGEFVAKEKVESVDRKIQLWRLLDMDHYMNWLDDEDSSADRKFDAHLQSAYKVKTVLKLNKSEALKVVRNDYMNVSFDNELGTIECLTRNEGDAVIIEIALELKHGLVLADEWEQFLEFDKTLRSLLSQSVVYESL